MSRRPSLTGSLEVGKAGDFIILDRNLYESTPEEIGATRVLATCVDGVAVYRSL